MKLLIVADLHYALPQFDWLLEAAPRYDMVIVAGDLLDTASSVDPGAQIVVVLNYLKRIGQRTRLVVCSGNHDLDAMNPAGEKHADWMRAIGALSIPTDGDTVMVGQTMLSVCAWWDGAETQGAIAAQLEAAADRPRDSWIWVYHAPPNDSPVSWSGYRHFGDNALTGWIARHKPDIVLSGHVHEAPFVRNGSWVDRIGETWLFNAGRQIGPVPASITIDLDRREAVWLSFEGAESIRLDAPLVRPIPPLTELPGWLPRAEAGVTA
jgi:Icc-related predicted phosphoesterase